MVISILEQWNPVLCSGMQDYTTILQTHGFLWTLLSHNASVKKQSDSLPCSSSPSAHKNCFGMNSKQDAWLHFMLESN